jgi:hypothetical protein
MAGTAKSYAATKIVLGPSDLWLKVAVPSAGARMTVAADLTPDATANPNAKHLGMTEAGCTFEYKPEIQDFGSDELTSPHLSRIISESLTIKGTFLQVFDWDLLEAMTVGGTKTANTSTTSGYDQLTMGGISNITTYSVAMIGPDIADATKYWVVQLYKSFNKAGFQFQVSRKDQSKAPFEFAGLSVTTRAIGDQIGNYWRSLVVGA